MGRSRWWMWTAVGALLAAACGGRAPDAAAPATTAAPAERAAPDAPCPPGQLLFGGDPEIPSDPGDPDAPFPWETSDPPVLDGFDADEIIPGGPPPDGIPPIDRPCFEDTAAGDAWLAPQSPVLTIAVGEEVRAYPLAILTWHEIVNDVIGDTPVVITYCPLCNSGLAFDRRVGDTVLDFGTSGRLYRSNLVMYDRQHRNLWTQFTGTAVVGDPWVGTRLERIPTGVVSWQEFRTAHPEGLVLSRSTGYRRDYGRNPYEGYEDRAVSFLYRGPIDDRIDPNSRVVGLSAPDGSDAVAITLEVLEQQRVVEVEIAGEPVVVVWAPGAASALDDPVIDQGRDVGQTGAFRPFTPDGRRLTFRPDPEDETRFRDAETDSVWNLFGEAVDGPLAGTVLEPVPRDDTFWFVWAAFRPDTALVA